MNKGELITAVSVETDLSKKDVDVALTAMLDVIVETVAAGHTVSLVGFGAFEPRDRKSREGRNPKTGEKMTIPATTTPGFSAGKPFKQKVASAQ